MSDLLITGFEGYGGRPDNPSASIARVLDGKVYSGGRVHARVLPVTNHNLRDNIISLIDQIQPSAVLSLGLAPGENMIRIERLAVNYSQFEIDDNAGNRCTGPIQDNAPQAYASTLPVEQLLKAVQDRSIPAYLSATAGTFLCNAIMYHALNYCHDAGLQTVSGFVHLPYLPSQVCDLITATTQSSTIELHQRSDMASMALATQLEAIEAIVEVLAGNTMDK